MNTFYICAFYVAGYIGCFAAAYDIEPRGRPVLCAFVAIVWPFLLVMSFTRYYIRNTLDD